ncbi:DNA-binding LacI/PurR family transcriptional regulator [Agromyces terreus]|uniref:DNA-binding LacI/PurR family transcriptional regulator n=1 Tax=Agromyces terreus TaxID=424795 RepID=A0A9X2GVK5_9MICO|nr:LacI family DNA-binding transcriptional regulator [Agromyces terreus]MCP2369810.1 DNA-binding LacI/PurR family transcriptional regulator [Agromyces terreus]
MTAISDVARLAGVSKATASRALSGHGHVAEQTRLRVVRAAAEIGYIASPDAASLVTGRTKNVGVVIPFVNSWFFGEVLEGIERTLLDAGYDLTLYNLPVSGEARARVFDFFLARKRVDAVIVIAVDLAEAEVQGLERREKPIVCIGGSGEASARLSIDDRAVGMLATEHLLHLGHTRIAHLGGIGAAGDPASVAGLRAAGFREAVAAASDGAAPARDVEAIVIETEMGMPGGFEAGLQLLGHPAHRPTAVFAASDETAFGVIRAAERLGLAVPGDLSVIGVDDHEHAALFDLTTIAQTPAEQGRLAVEVALRMLGDDAVADPLPDSGAPLATRLIVRGSTARVTA